MKTRPLVLVGGITGFHPKVEDWHARSSIKPTPGSVQPGRVQPLYQAVRSQPSKDDDACPAFTGFC